MVQSLDESKLEISATRNVGFVGASWCLRRQDCLSLLCGFTALVLIFKGDVLVPTSYPLMDAMDRSCHQCWIATKVLSCLLLAYSSCAWLALDSVL